MTLLLVLGTAIVLAAFALLRLFGSVLNPAVAFCFAWGGTLIAAALAERFGYFAISPQALSIFTVGILAFVAGAAPFASTSPAPSSLERFCRFNFNRVAWCCIALHSVMIPLSYTEASTIATGADDVYAAAYNIRASAVSGEERVGAIVGNYLTTGLFFIPLLFVGWRKRAIKGSSLVLLAAPWVILSLFILGRSSLFLLAFSLIYIHLALGGKISLRAFLLSVSLIASITVAGNLLVSKIDATADDPIADIASQSARGFFDYFIQGTILFSEYLNYQYKVAATWDALVFPCHLLEKFGLCQVPSRHMDFLRYADSADGYGNVYSVFFAMFPKYGWVGLLLISLLYGAAAGFAHRRRYASFSHLLLSSLLFSAVVLSVHSDQFGSNLYFLLKILAISLVATRVFKKT